MAQIATAAKHSDEGTKIEVVETISWTRTQYQCADNDLCDSNLSSDISSSCESSSREGFEIELSDSDSQTPTQEILSPLSFLTTSLQHATIESEGYCFNVRRRLSDSLEAEIRSTFEDEDNASLTNSTNSQNYSISLANLDDLCLKNEPHGISSPARASHSCGSLDTSPSLNRFTSTLSPRYTRKSLHSPFSTPHCKVKRCPLPIFSNNLKNSEIEVFVSLSPCKKMQKVKSQTLLPCIRGSHPELNCISGETVCKLIDGEYDALSEYYLVDCRFPYEFEGGHIKNAINIYDMDDIKKKFIDNYKPSNKPQAVIFY
jgi:hypothetical protein